jgi:hypothetical protein
MGSRSNIQASSVNFVDDLGERTKKPPLIHPPSPLGFSWKAVDLVVLEPECTEARVGCTLVRVTSLPCFDERRCSR